MAEAVQALRMLRNGSVTGYGPKRRALVIATVIAWIEDREREIADIELGATRLLLQAAQELGERGR
jgi:hypothetical protein